MPHTTRVLHSEWTKIRSVRSTLWTLATALTVTVGLSAVICAFTASQFDKLPKQRPADLRRRPRRASRAPASGSSR